MRVLKFGGKSLSSVQKFDEIAQKLSSQDMSQTLVVVSAMGNTTTELFKMAESLASTSSKREQDMLLTAGERISAALMSMALQKYNIKAQSFTGSQAGILTLGPHTDASIKEIKPFRIEETLKQSIVPVIAGFQGVDPANKEITTLGRGGTDLTAVALADYFDAHVEFYKSVGGVFSCDPQLCSQAHPLKKVSTDFLTKISAWGGKVIHEKAAQLAQEHQIKLKFYDDQDFKLFTQTSESCENFVVSSLDSLLTLQVKNQSITSAISFMDDNLSINEKPSWKILASAYDQGNSRFIIKTDPEKKLSLEKHIEQNAQFELLQNNLVGISCIFSKTPDPKVVKKLLKELDPFPITRFLESNYRYSFFLEDKYKEDFIEKAHRTLLPSYYA